MKLSGEITLDASAESVWEILGHQLAEIGDWATAIETSRPAPEPTYELPGRSARPDRLDVDRVAYDLPRARYSPRLRECLGGPQQHLRRHARVERALAATHLTLSALFGMCFALIVPMLSGPDQLFELFVHAVYGLLLVPFFASALQPQEAPQGSPARYPTIAAGS